MKKTNKIAELEILRAFAFLAVVLQHAIGHYAYAPGTTLADGVMLGGLLLLAKFAVPIFIFISGMVLCYRYKTEPVPLFPFLRKRIKDIFLPYLPWAVLYASIEGDHLISPLKHMSDMGTKLFTGTASYHLWYVIMTFQFYLLFPLLHGIVLKVNQRLTASGWGWTLLGLGLLYIGLTGQVSLIGHWTEGIPGVGDFFGEYSDRNVLYFFYYFVLGAFAGLHLERFKSLLLRYKQVLIGLFVVLLLWTWYRIVEHFQTVPELQIQYNDTLLIQPKMAIVLIASIPAMYLAAIFFTERASAALQRFMSIIGSYSYVAYLAHALMLVAATLIADDFLFFMNPTLRTLAAFAICSALSVAAAAAIRRLSASARRILSRTNSNAPMGKTESR
ncbi:acyltransferase [Paenibacillus cremeus]|uniref:Acyltransferase n=1 Tax=Paenibacillus cremeus TaxID=2163881 RepID=A0A559K637_9BACL|nr:acyltransferase [Paenibacillus cremeus]TVY07611.1 acyltransferase [Paenibacillus cremeus]